MLVMTMQCAFISACCSQSCLPRTGRTSGRRGSTARAVPWALGGMPLFSCDRRFSPRRRLVELALLPPVSCRPSSPPSLLSTPRRSSDPIARRASRPHVASPVPPAHTPRRRPGPPAQDVGQPLARVGRDGLVVDLGQGAQRQPRGRARTRTCGLADSERGQSDPDEGGWRRGGPQGGIVERGCCW